MLNATLFFGKAFPLLIGQTLPTDTKFSWYKRIEHITASYSKELLQSPNVPQRVKADMLLLGWLSGMLQATLEGKDASEAVDPNGKETIQLCYNLLRMDPSHLSVRELLVVSLITTEKFAAAEREARILTSLTGSTYYRLLHALMLGRWGKHRQSEPILRQLLQEDPESLLARQLLTTLLLHQSLENPAALAEARQHLAVLKDKLPSENDHQLWMLLTQTAYAGLEGNWGDGEKHLKDAAAIDEDNEDYIALHQFWQGFRAPLMPKTTPAP